MVSVLSCGRKVGHGLHNGLDLKEDSSYPTEVFRISPMKETIHTEIVFAKQKKPRSASGLIKEGVRNAQSEMRVFQFAKWLKAENDQRETTCHERGE